MCSLWEAVTEVESDWDRKKRSHNDAGKGAFTRIQRPPAPLTSTILRSEPDSESHLLISAPSSSLWLWICVIFAVTYGDPTFPGTPLLIYECSCLKNKALTTTVWVKTEFDIFLLVSQKQLSMSQCHLQKAIKTKQRLIVHQETAPTETKHS